MMLSQTLFLSLKVDLCLWSHFHMHWPFHLLHTCLFIYPFCFKFSSCTSHDSHAQKCWFIYLPLWPYEGLRKLIISLMLCFQGGDHEKTKTSQCCSLHGSGNSCPKSFDCYRISSQVCWLAYTSFDIYFNILDMTFWKLLQYILSLC